MLAEVSCSASARSSMRAVNSSTCDRDSPVARRFQALITQEVLVAGDRKVNAHETASILMVIISVNVYALNIRVNHNFDYFVPVNQTKLERELERDAITCLKS